MAVETKQASEPKIKRFQDLGRDELITLISEHGRNGLVNLAAEMFVESNNAATRAYLLRIMLEAVE